MPCHIPGVCSQQPDCHDRLCPGLYQQDGGHSIHGGIVFPIEEAADEPTVTPEQAEGWTAYLGFALLALASACAALAWITFTNH